MFRFLVLCLAVAAGGFAIAEAAAGVLHAIGIVLFICGVGPIFATFLALIFAGESLIGEGSYLDREEEEDERYDYE